MCLRSQRRASVSDSKVLLLVGLFERRKNDVNASRNVKCVVCFYVSFGWSRRATFPFSGEAMCKLSTPKARHDEFHNSSHLTRSQYVMFSLLKIIRTKGRKTTKRIKLEQGGQKGILNR